MQKSKPLLQKGVTLLNTSLHTFNLPELIEKLKTKHTWVKGELNAMVLFKSSETQIVLTALHSGTEIKSIQPDESITFQVIEGSLKFRTRKEMVTLEKGQLLTLQEKIKYSLKTQQETILLITIEYGLRQLLTN